MPKLRLVFTLWLLTTGFSQAEKQSFTSHSLTQAFHHPQTDVILPREIAGFKITSIARYGDSDFDGDNISVRFIGDNNNNNNNKIDIYFYLGNDPYLKDDKNHQAITSQIGETLGVINQLAAKGKTYCDVKTGDEAQVYSYADNLTMIQSVMNYRQINPITKKFDQAPLESSVAITIYANYFVKIRHSFTASKDVKQLEQQREKQEDFRKAVCQLIADTEIRPDILKALKTFQTHPQNRDSLAIISAYAEASKLVHISIQSEYMPYLAKDNFTGREILLVAFMAGNIDAQLKNSRFESHDLAGIQQTLKTYQILKKTKDVSIDPTLERWLTLTKNELNKTVVSQTGNENK